jgi:predicted metalloprotease
VGAALHSDGDYAPIAILAHEWGHAADYWYRYSRKLYSWETFYTEQLADCLAGAVTRSAERAGYLERGDLEEAERTIQSAGDPINPNRPKTSSEKIDEGWRKLHSHGEPADRLQAFRKGYRGEAAACLADRRLIPVH